MSTQLPHMVLATPWQIQHVSPLRYLPANLSSRFTPVPSHCPHTLNPVPRHTCAPVAPPPTPASQSPTGGSGVRLGLGRGTPCLLWGRTTRVKMHHASEPTVVASV